MKRLLRLMLVIIGVMVVVVVGGAIFYSHYRANHSGPKKLTAAQQQALQVTLPQMTTNLESGGIVQFTVALQASNASTESEVKALTPSIQDKLNRIMRQYSENELDSIQGLSKLKEEILNQVNDGLPQGSVTKVLFVKILTQ